MKVSQPVLKSPAKYFEVKLRCPACNHDGFYRINIEKQDKGASDQECHYCGAIMTIQWEK